MSRVHRLLTGDGPAAEGAIGRAYQTQVRRVRSLLAELEAVAPERAERWKEAERRRRDEGDDDQD